MKKNVSAERNKYRKSGFLNLIEELESLIALNILSFNIIEF